MSYFIQCFIIISMSVAAAAAAAIVSSPISFEHFHYAHS